MLIQHIHLPRYSWQAIIFYAVTDYYTDDILNALESIDCPKHYLVTSERQIRARNLNTGITYSNPEMRRSVVVIGLADSPEQYSNSIAHERAHLVTHIAQEDDISLNGEEICYLTGDIAQKMYPISHRFTCSSCLKTTRRKLQH